MPDAPAKGKSIKRLGYAFMMIAVLVCSAATVMNNNLPGAGSVSVGSFSFSVRYFPLIILSAVFGEVPGMLCVLIVFLHELILNKNVAFLNFIFLVIVVVVFNLSVNRRFLTFLRSFFSGILLAVLIGDIWGLLSDILQENSLLERSVGYLLSDFLIEAPECVGAAVLIWAFFHFAPDKIKDYTPVGRQYTQSVTAPPVGIRRGSAVISKKVTTIIVGEAVVLSVFAALFANLLLPSVMANNDPDDMVRVNGPVPTEAFAAELPDELKEFGERMHERIEQGAREDMGMGTDNFFIFSRSRVAFDLKLIMMIMTLAVPIAVITNFIAQRTIAIPISKMAAYLKKFAAAAGDDRELIEAADSISELDVRNRDELGDLYQSIDSTVHRLVDNIERVKKEAELENDLKVARRANEAKSTFLSNMSHEIRTPINAVLGMNEMILRESEEPATLEYATNIKNAGKSLLSQVNDILDFSKIEAGKMEILPVQYELSSTINDLVNMIASRVKDKHLELIVHVDETMPHLLFGDEVRIKQVVTNILTNAVKYTEKGSVTMDVSFERVKEGDRTEDAEGEEGHLIEEPEKKIWLAVSVSDTGIGIKEEDLGKLFSPFERIEEIRNRTVEGTGLGMSIVKKLLAMMDTRLKVKSVYGEGSEFSFRVVQEVVSWDAIGDFEATYRKSVESMERYKESFRAPKARILVTDDTKMNLTVIKGLLKQTRIQVDTAESGQQTLDMVRENHYDALFIDHMMPEMDGLETIAAIKAMSSDENKSAGAPVIALTANAVSGAREMYLEAGFTDYLSKPIDAVKLEKLLKGLLPQELVLEPEDPDFDEADKAVGDKITSSIITNDIITSDTITGDTDIMGTLKEVRDVDLDAALSATGGEDVLLEVMRDFYLAIPEKAELIERHVRDGNLREYTVQVHALKSSARLIGAMELSREAARLEACGNAGEREEIERATPALLSAYRAYEDKLSPVAAEDDENKEPIDGAMLNDARESLKEAVSAQDFDTADEIFKMLKDYALPESERVFWKAVERKLSAVDRDGLLAIL